MRNITATRLIAILCVRVFETIHSVECMDKSATYIVSHSCRSLLSFRLHDTLLIKIADAMMVVRQRRRSIASKNDHDKIIMQLIECQVSTFRIRLHGFFPTFSPLALSFTHTHTPRRFSHFQRCQITNKFLFLCLSQVRFHVTPDPENALRNAMYRYLSHRIICSS